MIKVLYILRRRDDMEPEAFRSYWKDVHGPLTAKVPGLRACVQSHPYPDPHDDPLPADGVEELQFEDVAGMQDALASSEGQAMLADFSNFLSQEHSGAIVIEEEHRVLG